MKDTRCTAVLGTVASDSHMWNLMFLQLLLGEMGYRVVNLGVCVPAGFFLEQCRQHRPDLVVVSSVNGHGYTEGWALAELLRTDPALDGVPMVIGGKLGTAGPLDETQTADLLAAGFDAVFADGSDPRQFLDFVRRPVLVEAG
ncbi:cobalamin-dependent protein [Actinoplanes sp. NEAU-A12]|uniref:Cobalamin-dependent protein n=1 Tax=Actinoplanes sandaracinus TaxID=3045177 RepID=A0ABT6WHT9_9ACTN|nr:cobalamin-dependent protein [Actinoplanes sandaracinus]MDI6099245.1 cobalamin-dependent protein [Actinoplanes sandaracinus]